MICTQRDEFIGENAYFWTASLSNGQLVFQDEGRPGLEPSAWLRLLKYCEQNSLWIEFIDLHFRSHHERVAEGADAYYFAKGVKAWFGGGAHDTFNVGQLRGGRLTVARWLMPEILLDDVEERDPKCLLIPGKETFLGLSQSNLSQS